MVKRFFDFKSKFKRDKLSNDFSSEEAKFPFLQKLVISTESKTYKNEIKHSIKLIEDANVEDSSIVDYISSFVTTNEEARGCFQFCLVGNENVSLLHYATKYSRPFVTNYLIDELTIDVNTQTKSEMTPLHYLVKYNAFRKEFDSKSNTDSTFLGTDDLDFKSVIEIERRKRFKRTLELLIKKGANYNGQDKSGCTPLHYAALNDNYEAALFLTDIKKINLEFENESSFTPLHIACQLGYEEIACLLIEKTSILSLSAYTNKNSPLHLACSFKIEKTRIVKDILERIKSEMSTSDLNHVLNKLDANNQSILNISIDNNHLNIIDLLLKDYIEDKNIEDHHGNLPIHLAAKNGSKDLFQILVNRNAVSFRNNSNGENALHVAAFNNKFNFIKEFLAYEKAYVEKNELKDHVLSATCLNRNKCTPLFLAIIGGHTKCVELLANLDYIDLEARDLEGNSIYHMCAEYNNFESLRYLVTRKDPRFLKPLYIKNNQEETVIHTACKFENLEIIKLVLSKIYDGFMSTESFLVQQNKEGKSFFHIACAKGHYNVVEYFLKDLKMKFLMENPDRELNKPIHLASIYGHISIVKLLLDFGADMTAKNLSGNNPLEISCRKGFFEISKALINHYPKLIDEEKVNDDPLHVACHEGAYEVVRLLLLKGAVIDTLNHESKNCLDIAIEKGHREVIKVLLENKNWRKLFQNEIELMPPSNSSGDFKKKRYVKESPQINAMYENKMWDIIRIVLDKCHEDDEYDFGKLDPACRNINMHPLMLLAKSGQETLLKHDTTLMLLNLKWRFIPRILFYANLLFYLFYLILFTMYSYEMQQIHHNSLLNKTISVNSGQPRLVLPKGNKTFEGDDNYITEEKKNSNTLPYEPIVVFYLIYVLAIISFKKCLQIVFISRLSFFTSLSDWFEIFTYGLAFATILSKDVQTKFSCGSVALLLSFLAFALLIEKLRVFGLFVLAFKKTLVKSATFLPVFLIIYTGFTMSFRLRSDFGVSLFNTTTSLSVIRTFAMVIGDFSVSDMGLEDGISVNYFLYCLFISIMLIIILNMLVGIAVGEISMILNEADIQQISMRIIFVLKCQDVLKSFSERALLKKYLNLRFQRYSYNDEYKFIKLKDNLYNFFTHTFTSKEPEIKLDDPQKRLEENLTELARITNEDLKTIREVLTTQITQVATKLGNSQQRLEDSLLETANKNVSNIESSNEGSTIQLMSVEKNLTKSQNQIKHVLDDFYRHTNKKLAALKQSITAKFIRLENQFVPPQKGLEIGVNDLFVKTNHIINMSNNEFSNLNRLINGIINQMNNFQMTNNNLVLMMNGFQSELTKMNQDIKNLAKEVSINADNQTSLSSQINNFKAVNNDLVGQINSLKLQVTNMDSGLKELGKKSLVPNVVEDKKQQQPSNLTALTSADLEMKYQIVKEQEIRESSGSDEDANL